MIRRSLAVALATALLPLSAHAADLLQAVSPTQAA